MRECLLTPLFVAAVFVSLSFLSLSPRLMSNVKVEAQTACNGPKLNSEVSYIGRLDPYWPTGTAVKVYFRRDHFSSEQINTMKAAFEA